MKKFSIIFITLLCIICLAACGSESTQGATATKDTDSRSKGEMIPGEHIDINIPEDNGYDIYKVPMGIDAGYRYGPSFIVYEDGTIDAWFASGGSSTEQWDWIVYKHYDGEFWGEEKCVLQPTPNALDHYSCCDPGVIYLNGYYYLAYTATLNENQADNNLFVARSKDPDGPYEKWNGNGWGGFEPKPIVAFEEDQSLWGVGEASFVELDGTLYVYYTANGSSGHNTLVATADASDENWPATMKYKGIALKNSTCDAIDVKYIDEYKRFIAVASDERLTENSYLTFFESKDGITFTEVDALKKNVYEFCHNPGLSGSENGHITEGRKTFVAYAYGPQWGVWNTRFQEIDINLSDNANTLEKSEDNLKVENLERDSRSTYSLDFVGISAQTNCVVSAPVSQKHLPVHLAACNVFHDRWTSLELYRDEVKMYGYDESVIKRLGDDSLRFEIAGEGETMITVEFRGHLTYIYVIIYNDSVKGNMTSLEPLFSDTITIDKTAFVNYMPQIKSKAVYDNGSWEMIWAPEIYDITYDYDPEVIKVSENGHIIPKENGTHKIKVSCEGNSYELTVNAILPDLCDLSFEKGSIAYDIIDQMNNTETSITEDGYLLCTTVTDSDPYINLKLSGAYMKANDFSSVSVTYMIPEANSLDSYGMQVFFRCEEERLSEEISQRSPLICDGQYHKITFELKNEHYWHGIVSDIRIDYFDTCGTGDEFYIKSIEFN